MFIAKLFVYICEKSYALNSYHTMHMCQQLQQQQKQKQQPTEVKLFTQWKKHVFFNTQINTYGCVHDCVCVFLSLSFSHIYFIPTLYCVIKNKLRIQGEKETGRNEERQRTHFNTNFDYEICASIYRSSRKTKDRAGGQFPTDIC